MEEEIQGRLLTEIIVEKCLRFKIIELIENIEAVFRDKVPREKILLRTALREIKKEEAAKFQGAFYCLLMLFIPEESHIEKWNKKELVLLVNLNSTNRQDKKSTIKKNFPVLSSGSVENYLKWTNDMWYIIKNKPCTSPASK